MTKCMKGFSLLRYGPHRVLHSFPARRSSDLLKLRCHAIGILRDHVRRLGDVKQRVELETRARREVPRSVRRAVEEVQVMRARDRKSTRLNSSHPSISYAVFCVKTNTPHRCLA